MREARIQLLTFDGCPLAEAARASLRNALAELGLTDFEEIDLLDPATPEELRGWGSPTILVNGRDASGNAKGDGIGCRIYSGPDRVPNSATIVAAVRERSRQ